MTSARSAGDNDEDAAGVTAAAALAGVRDLARAVFGFPQLRPTQEAALTPVLQGRDTLAVLATGAGKSAIYQLAGLALGGLTVVVSPLVALQRDQLRALSGRRLPDGREIRSGEINAAQPSAEHRATTQALNRGELDFLLLGPEQLARPATRDFLAVSPRPTRLLAVDEAHLVSEWGFDFRPDYLQLGDLRSLLGAPQVLALTATAAPRVQTEITRRLRMHAPAVVVAGFDRPSIALAVHTRHGGTARDRDAADDLVVREVLAGQTPALVYAGTRQHTETLALQLCQVDMRAAAYHAGLSPKNRSATQDAFLADQLDVVVATSAFGMGIDKPDVRSVIHASPPGSLDEYYQEVGRAGRDGLQARAVLVFNPLDLRLLRLFAAGSRVKDADVDAVLAALTRLELDADHPPTIELAELARLTGVGHDRAERVVQRLADVGAAELHGTAVTVPVATAPHSPEVIRQSEQAASAAHAAEMRRQAIATSRIDAVRHYAETTHCRRAELLAYFGEHYEPPCGRCDNDRGPSTTAVTASASSSGRSPRARAGAGAAGPSVQPRPTAPCPPALADLPGRIAVHRLWGAGTVLSADDHELVIAFDAVGYKHLTLGVLFNGILSLDASTSTGSTP
jgi:ATP-dependent DNA helicase RecQ